MIFIFFSADNLAKREPSTSLDTKTRYLIIAEQKVKITDISVIDV